ncbi:hypothetical protein DMENIID0001_005070 [Sergentomyia squamirostris]
MSEFSGGPGPPRTFNLNDHLHRGEMPPLTSSIKKKNPSYKALKTSFFNHPSDVEKYFVISGDAVRHMDVFEIQESLEKISSVDFKTCTILGSGDILIQTQNALQIESLKATSTFGSDNQPVSISENGVLNQSQALVRSKHLAKIVVERICSKLSDQKVVNVQRLKRKEGNIWVDTPTHLLTFNTPIVPNEVRCGVLNLKTEIYIPAPFRCVRCQKIGHTKKRCDVEKNQHICGNCAKEFHDGECTSPSKCVNCGNAHPSFSKLCPRYLDEKEINAIRVTERIPYSLARAEFRKRRKIPNLRTPKPYSDVLQASSSRTQMSAGSDFSQQSREIPSSQELLHIPESQHMLATSSPSFASTSASSTNNANSLSPSTSTNINSTNTLKRSKAWYRRDRRRKQKEREKGILAENLPVTPRENLHHTPPRAEQKSSSSEESPDPGLWGELPFRYKSTPELRRVLRVTQGEEKKRHKAIIPFVAPRVRANSKSAAVVFREVGASAPHFPILHQEWTIASPWAASSAATDSAGRIEWKRGDCGSLRESTSGSEAQSELLPEAEKKESSPAT